MKPTDPEHWKQYNDRPAAVRRHSEKLAAATGLDFPDDLAAIDDWLTPARKGAVTRKLKEHHDAQD